MPDATSSTEYSPANDPRPWPTISTTTMFTNRWITVAVDHVQLPTDEPYEYTRVDVNGVGVAVIGFNGAGEILLEREYRHGVGTVVWQLPGGLATDQEDIVAAGLRELLEESGYAPTNRSPETVRYLGTVWDNPGLGVAQSHIVAAWDLVETVHPRRDPAEFVTLHWRSLAWLKAAIQSGEVQDRVVLAALTYLMVNDIL